jgi:deoxyribonuclease-4
MRQYITQSYGSSMCTFDAELRGKNFAGHPDIVVRRNAETIIDDVKTTTNFEAMREETTLQLLSYAALARASGHVVNEIRVALPWNNMTISHDISDWDHTNFLFMLESAAAELRPTMTEADVQDVLNTLEIPETSDTRPPDDPYTEQLLPNPGNPDMNYDPMQHWQEQLGALGTSDSLDISNALAQAITTVIQSQNHDVASLTSTEVRSILRGSAEITDEWDVQEGAEHSHTGAMDPYAYADQLGFETVGCHIRREKTLLATFQTFYASWSKRAACQIFLAGNQFSKEKLFADDDLMQTSGFIAENNVRVYIHAPYSINLSRPRNQKSIDNGEPGSWALSLLRHQLEIGSVIGARGVVVHVGKPGTTKPKMSAPLTVSEAKTEMIRSVRAVLDTSSPECQLLVETPAGQGTELYTDVEELWDFWNEFTPAEKSRMGICIDTCHVFAAGHDPVEYLQFWLEHDSTAISLIHFNDSKHERGSRKDRHAPYGQGHIGEVTLSQVVEIANVYGIPMVME